MSIIRVKKNDKYFTASNEPFNDKRLSWETRGVIGYLLTKPNNWQVRMEDLEKQGTAGSHKLRRMLAEARQYGYMNRIRISNPDGTFDWITEIYESPSQNPKPSKSIIKRTSSRKSTSGQSTSGKVPDIVNTDETSTDIPLGNGETPAQPRAADFPGVQIFRSVTKRYPSKELFEKVSESIKKVGWRLGRDATSEDLESFFKEWQWRGYNKNSCAWLEWAESGVIPQNGNWKPQKFSADGLSQYLQGAMNGD